MCYQLDNIDEAVTMLRWKSIKRNQSNKRPRVSICQHNRKPSRLSITRLDIGRITNQQFMVAWSWLATTTRRLMAKLGSRNYWSRATWKHSKINQRITNSLRNISCCPGWSFGVQEWSSIIRNQFERLFVPQQADTSNSLDQTIYT